ncbi:tRNA pseudouridine(38-40) synthase TruA [uncultured Winogradskyella sp.]|uniref:tRNA pseudouridine(38-40) synthase TruA n=1 Tax=uncultured Winogradskyella sp. TaxID=395353 RepID=UPI0035130FDA
MRYFVELSYNGSAYHGWQVQPNAISVQEVLEKALSTILKSPVSIVGAGRTDTGVHAKQMFAHFDFEGDIARNDLVYKLNSFLPKDIVIYDIIKVKHDAHARFDATSRTYNYRISTSKNAFNYKFAYSVFLPLDLEAMNKACNILLMYNDFQCFSKTHTDVKTYYCNIKAAQLRKEDDEIIFTITADRFLRNMVRAIVGTLINIGLGKMEVEELHRIIKSKDRSEAGFSVPAHGLYLTEVKYPDDIFLKD